MLTAMPGVAHAFWPRFYRPIERLEPFTRRVWRRFGIGNVVEVVISGRHTGEPRTLFLGLLRTDDRTYVGHRPVAVPAVDDLEVREGGRQDATVVAVEVAEDAEDDVGGGVDVGVGGGGQLGHGAWAPFGHRAWPHLRIPAIGVRGSATLSFDVVAAPMRYLRPMTADADRDALEAALAGRGEYELFPCDPALADTAAFCAAYGFAPEDSANTIVVVGKGDPPVYAACVVLATHRLDVNRAVKGRFGPQVVVRRRRTRRGR